MHRRTGDNQITHTGQAGKRLASAAQRRAQTRNLRQSARHESRLGIISQTDAVTDTCRQRDDILKASAQLRADNIRRDIHAESVIHKRLLHQRSCLSRCRRRQNARQNPARHFLRMGRARQCNHRILSVGCPCDGLREAAIAIVPIQSLSDIDNRNTCLNNARQLLRRRMHSKGRNRHQHKICRRCTVQIGRDFNFFRQLDARKQLFIAALFTQQLALLFKTGP